MILCFNYLRFFEMEKYLPKIKAFSKKLLVWIVFLFLISIVLTDLDRPGGGYIEWVVFGAMTIVTGCYADIQEITHKPLASLTIANLVTLAFYFYLVVILLFIGKGIWSEISEYLEERDEKQREIDREIWLQKEKERREEEELYSGESSERCRQTVINMEKTETLEELESLYEYATQTWPKWKYSLSKVYNKRKKWLDKNKPGSEG